MGSSQNQLKSAQNERMEKVISNYLEMDTSYALLMNGHRGIGKTFFVKTNMLPLIKKIPVRDDHSKNYIPVYISLFGLKNIDEVYVSLVLEFMPWLKNKKVKIGSSLAKLVSRGLLNYYKAGDIDLYKEDIWQISKNSLETKDFVLIFDDLDRISSSLQVGEVIGFVNALVEHGNNKIIIIGDDDQFKSENNYTAVKEKTIGTVIEYATEMADNYDLIIKARYEAKAKVFYEFLKSKKTDILHWFKVTNTKSLRTLIYFLEHFYYIFGEAYLKLEIDKQEAESLAHRKLDAILNFSVAVSIEFKGGRISYKKTSGIDDMKALNLYMSKKSIGNSLREPSEEAQSKPDLNPSTLSFSQKFVDTYFNNNYEFYSSLFNFLTGGDSFEIEPLMNDLKKNFDDRIIVPTPQEAVWQKLADPAVYDLEDSEHIELLDQMLDYALKAMYPLDRYIPILFYMQRFPEVKAYDINGIKDDLIKAIREHARKFAYDDELKDKFDATEKRKNSAFFIEIYQEINDVNNSNRANQVEQYRADMFKEFRDTPYLFYANTDGLADVPFLASWDFNAFYAHFQKMRASDIPRFMRFIKKRYEFPAKDKMEYTFISRLFDELAKHSEKKNTMRIVAEQNLANVLKDIISRSYPYHQR